MTIVPARRWLLATVSAFLALILLRPLIADALCMRGDEFLRSGDPVTAQHYYRFALAGDPNSGTAAERFVFAALEIHARTALAVGVNVADEYLSRHDDQAIRIDRALALWSLRDFARAANELSVVAASTHDRRYARLAQIAASRAARARR
jgi:Tfp pilus assembly protein PilF